MERRYPKGRDQVRKKLATLFSSLTKDAPTITHESLIQLATNRKNKVRLVTTNFDRLFQQVITEKKIDIPVYSAPLLPIPKKSSWDGIVYLHGLLPESSDESELNRLVLTSGDFGLAYLTERWASRFVTELFKNYTICFVGYSINDPILRYIMDAFAVDKFLGETRPEAFAFASYNTEKKEQAEDEWKAKKVTPLLYKAPKESEGKHDHSVLHKTLKEWADIFRDGVQGKKMIISKHASTPPPTSSDEYFAVRRVLWALTDESAAKHFADLNPVPPLEWLGPLSEKQFGHRDLSRFGVTANSVEDKNLRFSIFHRPAPYTHSPSMCVVDNGAQYCTWDNDVIVYLSLWLTRHLGDPKLIIWLANQGGRLHEIFVNQICNRLNKLDDLVENGKEDEIKRIVESAPNAIPSPPMRTLWRLFITGRIKEHTNTTRFIYSGNLRYCIKRIKKVGLTPSLRMELCESLTPKVTLGAPFTSPRDIYSEYKPAQSGPERIKDLVDCKIELTSNNVHYFINEWAKDENYNKIIPNLLQDFTLLLRDALDLAREVELADDRNDLSHIYQPSISNHDQNNTYRDWTALIRLTRDAWLATAQSDPEMARYTAEGWWHQSYPLFKRLALFAASDDKVISHQQALDWLLGDNCWWLWSVETQREAMCLLVFLASRLDSSEVLKLEKAILAGPPREMFNEDRKDEEWKNIINRSIWLRLAKYQDAGGKWSEEAIAKLDKLNKENPNWKLAKDERDEFPSWVGTDEDRYTYSPVPESCQEIVEWLKEHENPERLEKDDWRPRCRDDFNNTSRALCKLVEEGKWIDECWKQAFWAWSENSDNKQWTYLAPILNNAPDEKIKLYSRELSQWLLSIAKVFENKEDIFLKLCHKILAQNYSDEKISDDPVTQAINHSVGIVTDALIQLWYRKLEIDQSLPEELKGIFTNLCDTQINKFKFGRIILTLHITTFYRVDLNWTKKYLLPLFDWSSSPEALIIWKSFIFSPRLYMPFLADIKEPLLEGAKHYQEFGMHAGQFAAFLTHISLNHGDFFTTEELANSTKCLTKEGLESTVQTLTRAFKSTEDKRKEYWNNRLIPYLRNIWPKDSSLITNAISESFAILCLTDDELFPEVFQELKIYINKLENPHILYSIMNEKKICKKHQEEALSFLDWILRDDIDFLLNDFQECLIDIKSNEKLKADPRFVRLEELAQRKSINL